MSIFNKLNFGVSVAAIVVGATLAFVAPASSANLVQNGDFETGNLTYWTMTGNFITGYNEVRNTPIDGGGPYPGSSYFLVLGNFPGTGANAGIAGVSQTLSTVSGQTYDLSLAWTDSGTNTPGNQLFQVLWNNVPVDNIDGETASTSYQILSFLVTGTGSDTLTLQGYSFNAYNDIDNVSVEASVIPLPSTWTMLIAGFVGLGLFAYRGMKKNSAATLAA